MENKTVVVVKAVIGQQGKYLIVRRDDNDDIGAGTWEFPGGKIEFGENLEDALLREVKEETGISVSVVRLLYATTFMTNPQRQVVLMAYLCKPHGDDIKLSFEHSDYMWSDKEQFRERIAVAIITDMEKYGVFDILE